MKQIVSRCSISKKKKIRRKYEKKKTEGRGKRKSNEVLNASNDYGCKSTDTIGRALNQIPWDS